MAGFSLPYANPATLPTGVGEDISLSTTDAIVRHGTTPFVSAYPWSITGWGVKYSNPSGLPSVNSGGARFSAAGTDVVVSFLNTSPLIRAYPWTHGVGFGAAYSNPSTVVSSGGVAVTFVGSGAVITTGGNAAPHLHGYPFTSGSGWGAKYSNPGVDIPIQSFTSPTAVEVSPDSAAVFVSYRGSSTGVISAYPFTLGGGFGVKYADPSIGASGKTGALISVAPGNHAVLVGRNDSGTASGFPWTPGSGFGTKYTDFAISGASTGASFFDVLGTTVLISGAGSTPALEARTWTNSGGFGSAYGSPIGLASGIAYVTARALSSTLQFVAAAHGNTPFVIAWAFTTNQPPSPAQPDDCGPLNLQPKPLVVLPPEPVVRTYPHVDEVTDWPAQQSIKLLWDKVHDHESRIRAGVANDRQWVTAANAHGDKIITIQTAQAETSLIVHAGITPPDPVQPPLLTPPPTSPPPTTDPNPDPAPPPPGNPSIDAGDMIDLSAAQIVNAPDVRGGTWRKTAALTQVSFSGGQSRFDFSKRDGAGRWPDVTPAGWTGPLQYTVWLFKFIGGIWVGSAFIQFWHDRVGSGSVDDPDVPSRYHQHWYYAARWAPIFGSGAITPGQTIGFMVTSGNERDSVGPYSVQERSNVVTLAATDNGTFNF